MTKAFLPSMLEDNKGHIVSIASLAGFVGVPYFVDYCTSKFAIIGFEEALHMELIVNFFTFTYISNIIFARWINMFHKEKKYYL